MAVETKQVLVLTFGYSNDATQKTSINISKPKEGLTDAEIKTAMESVATAGALYKKGQAGAVDKVVEANYVNTETEEIAL